MHAASASEATIGTRRDSRSFCRSVGLSVGPSVSNDREFCERMADWIAMPFGVHGRSGGPSKGPCNRRGPDPFTCKVRVSGKFWGKWVTQANIEGESDAASSQITLGFLDMGNYHQKRPKIATSDGISFHRLAIDATPSIAAAEVVRAAYVGFVFICSDV